MPDTVARSQTEKQTELFYRHYGSTPVTSKFMCVVVMTAEDSFIVTAYFADTKKRGEILWEKR